MEKVEEERDEGGREGRWVRWLDTLLQVFYFQFYYQLQNCGFPCFSSLVSVFIQRLIRPFGKALTKKSR